MYAEYIMQFVVESAPMPGKSGRHFLQIPGPTNVPDRILRAMDRPTIDHRGPQFARLAAEIADGLRPVFGTKGPVIVFPSSGTGAWDAAIVNRSEERRVGKECRSRW